MKVHICNTSKSPQKAKARDVTFYLDQIRTRFGFEFDKLEAHCTDGDIRPPYPYQWRATTRARPGDDDPFEGLGGSPFEAIHHLWLNIRFDDEHPLEDEQDI